MKNVIACKIIGKLTVAYWCFLCYQVKNEENFNWWVGFRVLNATFNNISVISWRSNLLVEETGGTGENHRHAASH